VPPSAIASLGLVTGDATQEVQTAISKINAGSLVIQREINEASYLEIAWAFEGERLF